MGPQHPLPVGAREAQREQPRGVLCVDVRCRDEAEPPAGAGVSGNKSSRG